MKDIVDMTYAVIAALMLLFLSFIRYKDNKKFSEFYNERKKLKTRLILTTVLKSFSVIMILLSANHIISGFVLLYIITPVLVSLTLCTFRSSEAKKFASIIKAIFYLLVCMVSLIQFFIGRDMFAEMAFGISMTVIIFDCSFEVYNVITTYWMKEEKC